MCVLFQLHDKRSPLTVKDAPAKLQFSKFTLRKLLTSSKGFHVSLKNLHCLKSEPWKFVPSRFDRRKSHPLKSQLRNEVPTRDASEKSICLKSRYSYVSPSQLRSQSSSTLGSASSSAKPRLIWCSHGMGFVRLGYLREPLF